MSPQTPTPARGLGRGLAALLGDDAAVSAPGAGTQDMLHRVAIDRVRPNPEQPRSRFTDTALAELSASIREHGVLSPIIVRRDGAGFILIAGERRLRAAKMAGLTEIPVIVRGADLAPVVQLELALIENLQRADLDPIEAALGYQRLVQTYGHSQEMVAKKVGKDRATVANALRLLKLPEAGRRAVVEGRISAGHGRALLPLEAPELFSEGLATVIARELSVRATEAWVRAALAAPKKAPAPAAFDRLSRDLTRAVGSRVGITRRANGSGRITIDFGSADEMERLVTLMRR